MAAEPLPYVCPLCLLGFCDRCNGWMEVWNAAGSTRVVRCEHPHPRNVHCVICGNTRGGPRGHESSECRWRPRVAPRPPAAVSG